MPAPKRQRTEVLDALLRACLAHPEQRVMQVVVNALGTDPFYVEDPDAVRKLQDYAFTGQEES